MIKKNQKIERLTVLQLTQRVIGNRKRKFVLCKCDCGNLSTVEYYNLYSGRTKSCGCLNRENSIHRGRNRAGANNPNWKNGRKKDIHGYILIYYPNHPASNSNKYIQEHRLIVEKAIGRPLKKTECVHHFDEVKDNNVNTNLVACQDWGYHQTLHKRTRRLKMTKNQSKKRSDLMTLKEETVDFVLKKIQTFQKKDELDLPPNFSAANALKSAWLTLQSVVDKDKRPALDVCTKSSVANALLNMVIQGLNPSKSQCYFVVFGRDLTLMRSYLGNKAICLRVNPELQDIYSEVVYEDDKVVYNIVLGQRNIISHEQTLENIDGGKIVAAYAIAVDKEGVASRTELMTMDQIKAAWSQSKMKPITDSGSIKANTTHGKFTAEMAKKTVTNRLAKHIIGSSSDSNLVINSIVKTDDLAAQAEVQEEVDEKANAGEVIDIKPVEKKKRGRPKKETAPITKPEPEQEPEKAMDPDALEPLTAAEKQEILDAELAEAEEHGPGPGF